MAANREGLTGRSGVVPPVGTAEAVKIGRYSGRVVAAGHAPDVRRHWSMSAQRLLNAEVWRGRRSRKWRYGLRATGSVSTTCSGSRMVSASCHCAVSGRGSARPATVNAGRVVGVERSVDALWGESAPRTAVHVLHVYVSDLQRPLPEGILVTTPPGYMLRVPTGPSISPTSSASYPRVRSAAAADAGQRASRSESVPTPGSYVPRRNPNPECLLQDRWGTTV